MNSTVTPETVGESEDSSVMNESSVPEAGTTTVVTLEPEASIPAETEGSAPTGDSAPDARIIDGTDSSTLEGSAPDVTVSEAAIPETAIEPKKFFKFNSNRRRGTIYNRDGLAVETNIPHRDAAFEAVARLLSSGEITQEEAARLNDEARLSSLRHLDRVTVQYVAYGYHKTAGIQTRNGLMAIHSKQQGRNVLRKAADRIDPDYEYADATSFEQAHQALDASQLDEMTAEERAAIAPAHVKRVTGERALGKLPSGTLYAYGSKPLGQFFSTQGGQRLLYLAIETSQIQENDRSRITQEINALGMDAMQALPETSDIDTLMEELANGKKITFGPSLLLNSSATKNTPVTECNCLACSLDKMSALPRLLLGTLAQM
jgi:hypothetical protein